MEPKLLEQMAERIYNDGHMRPYVELSEDEKELQRKMVRQFERHLEELGYAIGIDATK